MTNRWFVFGALAVTPLLAQTKYKAPRTAWGDPDLRGYYLNRTTTPLERPQNLGSKEFYTEEEMKAREAAAAARPPRETQPGTQEDAHYDLAQFGLDSGTSGMVRSLRTSILTGPTGRLPKMLPAAEKRVADQRAANRGHEFDGPENRGTAERCILWNFEGPPFMPGGYNPNMQIFQGPGYVAIRYEMMGGARVVRVGSGSNDPAHPDAKIRQFYGDSVGHWEGDTLVIENTNFNEMPAVGRGATKNLRVIERLTRTADDTILYQFTVSDPSTWEESWSGEYPIQKFDGPIYEYACQEGNYGMPNILSGARAAEREAAAKK